MRVDKDNNRSPSVPTTNNEGSPRLPVSDDEGFPTVPANDNEGSPRVPASASVVVEKVAGLLRVCGVYIGCARLGTHLTRLYISFCVLISVLSLCAFVRAVVIVTSSTTNYATLITCTVGSLNLNLCGMLVLQAWFTGRHLQGVTTRWQQVVDRQGGECGYVCGYLRVVTVWRVVWWASIGGLVPIAVTFSWVMDDLYIIILLFLPPSGFHVSEATLRGIITASNLFCLVQFFGGGAFFSLYILFTAVIRKHFGIVRMKLADHIRDRGLGDVCLLDNNTEKSDHMTLPTEEDTERFGKPDDSKKPRDIDDVRIEYEAVVNLLEKADDLFSYFTWIRYLSCYM